MKLAVQICVLVACLTAGEMQAQDEIDVLSDIVYGKGGEVDLHLDLARPKNLAAPAPCIVVIHGGAWRQGDKSMHANEIRSFAKHGFVSASIQYRFCPKYRFPAQVEDVKCAVRYLRAHADKYGIDPDRIGAVGFSAGAHLSMLLGAMDPDDGFEGQGGWADQPSKVQAVVSFFGPTELAADDIPELSIPLVNALIGGPKEEHLQAFRDASPLTYISRGDAPMLLFQGTEDLLVPYSQAIKMVTAMTEADVPGRVEFLIDAGHGWGGADRELTVEATARFFQRHLRLGDK